MHDGIESFAERIYRVSTVQLSSRIVSPDDYRIDEFGAYRPDPALERLIWVTAHETLRKILRRGDASRVIMTVGVPGSGKSTYIAAAKADGVAYFDATMVRHSYRKGIVSIAREFQKPIEAIVFAPPLEECLRRNSMRSPDRIVPESVIRKMAETLEREPPAIWEGFKVIHYQGLEVPA